VDVHIVGRNRLFQHPAKGGLQTAFMIE
jgi:hypothetical protein